MSRNDGIRAGGNLTWQATRVTREHRETARKQRGAVLWFTGLSAAGKSTLASVVEERLHRRGYATYLLDGDNVRLGLNRDLGFAPDDRAENIRRVGEVARLFVDAGVLVCTAFISPYRADRQMVRDLMPRSADFVEIFVSCPLEICERRDPKRLYARARAGEIQNFTGIDAPYEHPARPEIVVDTYRNSPAECADRILAYLASRGYVRTPGTAAAGGG